MRLVVVMAVVCLAACASEKLGQAPPAGVDFSGHWKLNEADSDDPQRLIQAQFNAPPTGQSGAPGGRSGRQAGRGGGPNPGGPVGPVMPPVSVLNEGLRWPGKQLDIQQVAGVVAFTSGGINRICQPMDGGRAHRHHADGAHREGDSPGGDTRAQRREPPPRCGWTDKTLIVQSSDPDDDRPPFEEHYSLSEDSQRLVEVVEFTGGRSSGYTMSRVWDRSSQ